MEQRSAKRAVRNAADEPRPHALNGWAIDSVHPVDCVAMLRSLPEDSVDLAIADPPYNLAKGGHWAWDNSAPLPGFGGAWQKAMPAWDDRPLADYFAFTLTWLRELGRVVRPTGSLWIHGTYHNAGVLNVALQLLEIEIINEVVWYKRNSFPNLSGRRLTASHETILWAHTGGKQRRYFFNYEAARAMECPEDGLKSPGRQLRTVWDIPNNKDREEIRHGKHPTQKPLRLLKRMLEVSARPGDLVLVPFAGAGSECVAAKTFGAHFLAAETNDEYLEIARQRLSTCGKTATSPNPKSNGRSTVRGKPAASAAASSASASVATPQPADSTAGRGVPPLLKWTGSKRSQAASIAQLIPSHVRYFEPFLGGGALLYHLAGEGAVGGDLYRPLIELWQRVQAEPDRVVDDYRRQWTLLQQELDQLGDGWKAAAESAATASGSGADAKARPLLPRYYYQVRERFNRRPNPMDLNFLLRTCVNGIVRFNAAGKFNNSFHLSRRGMQPQRFAATVAAWVPRLKGVRFVCQDYQATVAEAQAGDFVYFDPPYAANQHRYTQNLDCQRFFATLEALNRRGVRWALSFDGRRGTQDLTFAVPPELYRQQVYLTSGNSAVHKVLNGPVEKVQESLYLNYE